MRTVAFLLRLCLFILIVRAKDDGQSPEDGGKGSSSTLSTSSTSSRPSTSASTVLSTSTVTTTDDDTATISSATATSAASTAIPANALQFTPPPNITMCESAIFTWAFNSSTSVPLTVVVTNERAVSDQIPSPEGTIPLVERTLSTAVDARVCVVSWPHADVAAGAYTVFATDTAHTGAISARSSQFFVNTGSDTSCLNQTSTASATASSTSESGISSGDGGSNDTAAPTSSSRSTRSMSIGAIVGTIAGILVGVGGLLLVFSLPRLRQRILRSRTPQHPGGPYMLF